jgi:hypothetical protein
VEEKGNKSPNARRINSSRSTFFPFLKKAHSFSPTPSQQQYSHRPRRWNLRTLINSPLSLFYTAADFLSSFRPSLRVLLAALVLFSITAGSRILPANRPPHPSAGPFSKSLHLLYTQPRRSLAVALPPSPPPCVSPHFPAPRRRPSGARALAVVSAVTQIGRDQYVLLLLEAPRHFSSRKGVFPLVTLTNVRRRPR